MYGSILEIDDEIRRMAEVAEERSAAAFARIDAVARCNGEKMLAAFMANKISESHLLGTSGYGYGDRGREGLDAVYAQVFGAEDALVRHSFASGTSTIATALFGVLRPGDVMVSLSGTPYDTLHAVLGIRDGGHGSLREFGIEYRELALLPDGRVDMDGIAEAVRGVKVAYLQRSRGYSLRPSIGIDEMERIFAVVRKANPDAIIMVDNCYGELVEEREPTQVGADLIMGSLIKNPGGGIARTGGYIAGRTALVEMCAHRATCAGMGKEVGCTLGESKNMYMGLFFAPTVVGAALRTAVLAAALFEKLGYETRPLFDETRTDIIQSVLLGSPQKLAAFCRGVQKGAPIDSFVTPEAWAMPGYDDPVIMAAGAFNMGASIELSADGPMREPYAAWLQGGLTYETGRLGIMLAAQTVIES